MIFISKFIEKNHLNFYRVGAKLLFKKGNLTDLGYGVRLCIINNLILPIIAVKFINMYDIYK